MTVERDSGRNLDQLMRELLILRSLANVQH